MTHSIILYCLAFIGFSSQAQSVKPKLRASSASLMSKQKASRQEPIAALTPMAVKPVPINQPAVFMHSPAASLMVSTKPILSTKAKVEQTSTTPTWVANPTLVASIHTKPYLLPIDRSAVRGSYPLGISDRKTTHIIFPATIKEFDAGTDYVLAQVPQTITNVLRVKANPKASAFCRADSGRETNMTVITEDGGFYSFLIRYQEEPEILNINIANNLTADDQTSRALGINRSAAITFTSSATANEGSGVDKSDVAYRCQRLNERKAFIHNIGASKMRVTNLLTGIYVANKILYMQFAVHNDSQIDYDVDFFKFYIRDKEVMKRMAAQELELKPYSQYPETLTLLRAKTARNCVYALPLTTLTEDRIIEVEMYEKNGGRHLRFEIEADVLLLAKPL